MPPNLFLSPVSSHIFFSMLCGDGAKPQLWSHLSFPGGLWDEGQTSAWDLEFLQMGLLWSSQETKAYFQVIGARGASRSLHFILLAFLYLLHLSYPPTTFPHLCKRPFNCPFLGWSSRFSKKRDSFWNFPSIHIIIFIFVVISECICKHSVLTLTNLL